MPRSLLETADLARVREGALRREGPAAAALACLLEGGALAHDPADPWWPDRDHVVVGGRSLAGEVATALYDVGQPADAAVTHVGDGRALAVAVGAAAAVEASGGVARVVCLLDAADLEHGATWEAALAGAERVALSVLTVVPPPVRGRGRGLFEAAGWRTVEAAALDPVEILGALDQLQADERRAGAALLWQP